MQDGTAGAVNLARPYVTGPVLIIFVDTVFEADLTLINRTDADGIIWAKEVEDYQRFGVVVTDEDGYMTKIVEKPSTPISQAGQHRALLHPRRRQRCGRGSTTCSTQPANKGEYYLTDAFQYMIEHGQADSRRRSGRLVRLRQARHVARDQRDPAAEGRGPAGRISRRHDSRSGLDRGRRHRSSGATIGPNVTIEAGTRVTGSRSATRSWDATPG